MNRRDLRNSVAEKMLTGPGLDVTMIAFDTILKAEQASQKPDHDKLEDLYDLRKSLRKLKENQD